MKIKAKVISNSTTFISKKGNTLYKFFVMTEYNDVVPVISEKNVNVSQNIEIEFVPRALFYK